MSHQSVIRLLDAVGVRHDEEVIKWRDDMFTRKCSVPQQIKVGSYNCMTVFHALLINLCFYRGMLLSCSHKM